MKVKVLVVVGIVATLGRTATVTAGTTGESVSSVEVAPVPVEAEADAADDGCRSDFEDGVRNANQEYQRRMGEAQNLEDVGGATGAFGDDMLFATGGFVSCVVE